MSFNSYNNTFFFRNVIKNPETIAEKLFTKQEAKKKLQYVKRYIRNNLDDLKNSIDDFSSDKAESDVEEDDHSISVDADDESENSASNIEKDEGISGINKRFQRMETDDDNSISSNSSQTVLKDLHNVKQSTPKSSRSRIDNGISMMEIEVLPQITGKSAGATKELVRETDSEIENDSGFVNTKNHTSTRIKADISLRNAAQGEK